MIKAYYATHSPFSDPEKCAYLYDTFSDDLSKIVYHIQNLFLHYADINLFSITVSDEQYSELNLRYTKNILEKIIEKDSRSLSFSRETKNKVMGVCRDTSLLLCSVLRNRGIPARLRSGFVNYFIPGLFLDGFCVEYFDDALQRWRSVDTRTMPLHIDHYKLPIDFDLTDVPDTKFISAAKAWQMCRFENADPVRFGSRQHRGLFTVRNRLLHDLALLNKHETLIWDVWEPMLSSSITDFDLLDKLSDLLLNDVNDIEKIIDFYKTHPQLQMPNTILVDNPLLTAEWITLC